MSLRDHFRPPLSVRRHWHAFYNAWATNLAEDINLKLPRRFFAEPNVQFGIEIDVAAWDEAAAVEGSTVAAAAQRGVAASATWQPSPPAMTLPMVVVEDVVEIAVFENEAGPELVGAIELVRCITIGMSIRGRYLIVAHTDRGDRIRIITARELTPSERRQYEEESQG